MAQGSNHTRHLPPHPNPFKLWYACTRGTPPKRRCTRLKRDYNSNHDRRVGKHAVSRPNRAPGRPSVHHYYLPTALCNAQIDNAVSSLPTRVEPNLIHSRGSVRAGEGRETLFSFSKTPGSCGFFVYGRAREAARRWGYNISGSVGIADEECTALPATEQWPPACLPRGIGKDAVAVTLWLNIVDAWGRVRGPDPPRDGGGRN